MTRVYDEWMGHHIEENLGTHFEEEWTNYLAGRTSAEIPTPYGR